MPMNAIQSHQMCQGGRCQLFFQEDGLMPADSHLCCSMGVE